MINRVFVILDQELAGDPGLVSPDLNVFYSVMADPAVDGSLQRAYRIMDDSSLPGLALALNLHRPLTPDDIRSIGSFMFLPAYLRLGGRPVIVLTGDPSVSADLYDDAGTALASWMSEQGFGYIAVHTVPAGEFFQSVEEVDKHFENISQNGPYFGKTLFFKMPAGSPSSATIPLQSVLASFQLGETPLWQKDPYFYAIVRQCQELEEKFNSLHRKYAASALELQHQQQYVDVLRSGHAAKEIQEFYNREYEVLPLWYKRFGQVLKVLMGKRTFSSLFRDNVKKYKV